jgi:hypothetical protein
MPRTPVAGAEAVVGGDDEAGTAVVAEIPGVGVGAGGTFVETHLWIDCRTIPSQAILLRLLHFVARKANAAVGLALNEERGAVLGP